MRFLCYGQDLPSAPTFEISGCPHKSIPYNVNAAVSAWATLCGFAVISTTLNHRFVYLIAIILMRESGKVKSKNRCFHKSPFSEKLDYSIIRGEKGFARVVRR